MDTWAFVALAAIALSVVLLYRQRQAKQAGKATDRKRQALHSLDTVQAWPPEATRILSTAERSAYANLVKAMPEYIVLAKVPLSRFLRVPTRHSYAEWLNRVGSQSADLLVCDRSSAVVAAIEIRSAKDSPRSVQRHEAMVKVLKSAKIKVLIWNEVALPEPQAIRDLLVPAPKEDTSTHGKPPEIKSFSAKPLGALPIPEIDEDTLQPDELLHEPPPSTWFDDLDGGEPPPPTRPTQH